MNRVKVGIMVGLMSILIIPCALAKEGEKIGYVDLSRLFDDYYKTKDYDKVLDAKNSEYEKERNAKIEKVREAQGKLSVLADAEKTKLQEEIETMKADLLEYDKQKRTDLTKERNEKIREILLEIEKIVSNFAQKEKYNVILNDRVLIYGDKGLDLTEEILKILNQGKPADDKPSEGKPAPK